MMCVIYSDTWIFANSGFKDYLVSVREKNSFRDDKNVFFFYTDPAVSINVGLKIWEKYVFNTLLANHYTYLLRNIEEEK